MCIYTNIAGGSYFTLHVYILIYQVGPISHYHSLLADILLYIEHTYSTHKLAHCTPLVPACTLHTATYFLGEEGQHCGDVNIVEEDVEMDTRHHPLLSPRQPPY